MPGGDPKFLRYYMQKESNLCAVVELFSYELIHKKSENMLPNISSYLLEELGI